MPDARSARLATREGATVRREPSGRLAAVFLPILMGAIAKVFGLEVSFFIVGGGILAVLGWLAIRDSGAQEKPNA